MRVAALYDIHGNLPALEAALEAIEREGIETILVGGDVSAGPFPVETLERCRALGDRVHWVRGNADRVLAGGGTANGRADAWCAEQLSAEQREFLGGLPDSCVLEIDGIGPVCFCHGSPRSDDEILTELTPDDRLVTVLAGVEQNVVVHGHTHVPYDRRAGARRLVCPGSIGMPYGETGAHWAIFGPDVALRRTQYDLAAAATRIRGSGWPQAERFAADNVLVVPDATDAIEFFERIAATEAGLGS